MIAAGGLLDGVPAERTQFSSALPCILPPMLLHYSALLLIFSALMLRANVIRGDTFLAIPTDFLLALDARGLIVL